MTENKQIQLSGSIAAVGFVLAVAFAVLFFMRLPIFSEATISWFFVFGLTTLSIGSIALILRAIWSRDASDNPYGSRDANGNPC